MILINSSPKDAAKMFQPFMPKYIPIGIGYLAAVMEREGLKVRIIDEQVEDNTIEKVKEYVNGLTSPYIFGFSVLTASYKTALTTARKLKCVYPHSIIIFGGPHPSALPEEVLTNPQVDIVVKGEGELILPELYRRLKYRQDYSDIKGISFRKGDTITHNERNTEIIDLDTLPAFPYLLFDETLGYDMGFIVSSRGCPFNCLSGDTIIDTTKGIFKIRDLVGTTPNVLTRDPKTKVPVYAKATTVAKTGTNRQLVRISFKEGNSIDCTPDHKFIVFKNGNQSCKTREYETEAGKLRPGDSVRAIHYETTKQGYVDIVKSVQYLEKLEDTYCMELPGYNWFYANEVLVHNCIFCSNRVTTGKRYRFRSPESTVEELCLLQERYHPEMVLFLDDNFLVNRQRVYHLIDLIKERGLHKKMKFSFQARGDSVDYTILQDLYRAGFQSVFFGLETSSEEIMKIIRKGETVADCITAVKMAKEIGFHVSATFIYGLPTETHQNRMDCARLANDLDIDMVRFNNATPYPGTELYELAKKEGRLYIQGVYENFNSVSTFIESPFKTTHFSYIPANNTEEEIRSDIILSYFMFYLNFRKLKRMFARHDEGVGWFNMGDHPLKKVPVLVTISFYMAVKFLQMVAFKVKKQFLQVYSKIPYT